MSLLGKDFYRISKAEWANVNRIVDEKQDIIVKQNDTIVEQISQIDALQAELKTLRKFKEKDDLLFSYEEDNRKLRKEKEELESGIRKASKKIKDADKQINAALTLERGYLRTINELKYKTYNDYETVSSDSLGILA